MTVKKHCPNPDGNYEWLDKQKYKTPEKLQQKIDEIFATWKSENRTPTLTGLAEDLGFATLKSLKDYQSKDEFHLIIVKARLRVERWLEEQLNSRAGSVQGIAFNLSSHYGWTTKTETINTNNQNGKISVEFVGGSKED